MNNRKNSKLSVRTTQIHLRVSEDEKKHFERKAKKAGYNSLSRFIRHLLTETQIISKSDIELVMQIKKIGVNINQIAFLCNQNKSDHHLVEMYDNLLNELDKLNSFSKFIMSK